MRAIIPWPAGAGSKANGMRSQPSAAADFAAEDGKPADTLSAGCVAALPEANGGVDVTSPARPIAATGLDGRVAVGAVD
jgi:hypothetical protein